MPTNSLLACKTGVEQIAGLQPASVGRPKTNAPGRGLAATITRAASKQTYYTVRFLVDRDRIVDAYRAYAYFRWVDDTLDQKNIEQAERLTFLERQQALAAGCYRRQPRSLAPEEYFLVDLLQRDSAEDSGLRAYIDNMMAVMAFDAERRSRLVSQAELNAYTHWLAVAVTEALHYFIGHNYCTPWSSARYLAATAAHIIHMLRDTIEDVAAGYYNIPREFLAAHGIKPQDVNSDPYRLWVRDRIQLARAHFAAGKAYLAQVENPRCRLAGCAYIARFEGVLDAIEREGYRLRSGYPECKGTAAVLRSCRLALTLAFSRFRSPLPSVELSYDRGKQLFHQPEVMLARIDRKNPGFWSSTNGGQDEIS